MKTYSLVVGARTVSGSARFKPNQEKQLLATTQKYFPNGFTVLRARGGWWNPEKKRFEEEESREVRVVSGGSVQVVRWARALCKALKQKEVLLTEVGKVRRVA